MPRQPDPHWLDRRDHADRRRRGPSDSETAVEDLLRTWYGDDTIAAAEMSTHRRGPTPIAGIVDQLLPQLRAQVSTDLALLTAQWSNLVGPDLARLCTPDAVRADTLDIAVPNAAALWVLRTQHLARLQSAVLAATHGRIRTVNLRPAGRRRPGES